MRERVRELAEQAGIEFDDDFPLEPETIYYYKLSDFEKFAELIVQECCDLIMKNQYNMVPGFMERMSAYSEVCVLKEHFGVDQ